MMAMIAIMAAKAKINENGDLIHRQTSSDAKTKDPLDIIMLWKHLRRRVQDIN